MLAIFIAFFGGSTPQAQAQYDNTYISYNDFYQNLAPFGQWIEDQQLGFVWVPDVDNDFRPYFTNGHWAMTNYGNTWVSDYVWGWACFHYGRWTYDAYYGWLWVPGSNWGPAWVSWRTGDGTFGWAPLSPEHTLSASKNEYNCPKDWWVFVSPKYMYSGNYYRYWYGPRNNAAIIKNSTTINNTYTHHNVVFVSGPAQKEVEKLAGVPIQVYKVVSSTNLNTRVHNDVVRMYRPQEILPATSVNGDKVTPPYVMLAPKQVGAPQSVNKGQADPEFKKLMPKNGGKMDAIGTNVNEPAVRVPPAKNKNTDHYDWDKNETTND